MLVAYLELEKYNSSSKDDYKKLQWLEFFSNKPFTNKPNEIISNEDHELDYKTWSKEEKKVYDERTRMIEQQLAATESAKIRGRTEGLAEGIEKGKLETYLSLVKEGILTKAQAAERLKISVSAFEKYL